MIDILLATYNGARYLRAQLDSIRSQSESQWRLFIVDDQSTDDTVALIREYVQRDARVTLVPSERHRGIKGAYEYLLAEKAADEYVMFCDQDDVWFPDKIERTMRLMMRMEDRFGSTVPLLVHTDAQLVDVHQNLLAPSYWEYLGVRHCVQRFDADPHYMAIHHVMQGCTMLFNQAARRIAVPFGPHALMHDEWVAMQVLINGGHIEPLAQPTMAYRVHNEQTLGIVAPRQSRRAIVRALRVTYPRLFTSTLNTLYWLARAKWLRVRKNFFFRK